MIYIPDPRAYHEAVKGALHYASREEVRKISSMLDHWYVLIRENGEKEVNESLLNYIRSAFHLAYLSIQMDEIIKNVDLIQERLMGAIQEQTISAGPVSKNKLN